MKAHGGRLARRHVGSVRRKLENKMFGPGIEPRSFLSHALAFTIYVGLLVMNMFQQIKYNINQLLCPETHANSNLPIGVCHLVVFLPEMSLLILHFYLRTKLSLKAIVTVFVQS